MNLEDYAYLDDGRWYVDPDVSLNEQNAFINNLRNLQAQDNVQIEQQTRGLGTQVPSQLGGLVGGGSYFRARQQTPQTNQTIAALRSAMQAQALQTALQNELEKEKKKYRDAQNKAAIASSNANNDTWSPDDKGGDGKKRPTDYVGTEEETVDAQGNNTWGGLYGAGLGIGVSQLLFPWAGSLGPLLSAYEGYRLGQNW